MIEYYKSNVYGEKPNYVFEVVKLLKIWESISLVNENESDI